jgi:hypothetical protein
MLGRMLRRTLVLSTGVAAALVISGVSTGAGGAVLADGSLGRPLTKGSSANGISLNGISLNGVSTDGVSLNGSTLDDVSTNGMTLNNASTS